MTVPTSSLITMGAAAAFCALLPIGILIGGAGPSVPACCPRYGVR